MKRIFVNIASYRDCYLAATLRSLIINESGRNKITYGIFEQSSLETSLISCFKEVLNLPNVRYKRIDPEYSDGVVWARAINAMQINDEEFMYQIDSHMLFDKDWDNYLIWDYEQAKNIANTEKIILSTGTKNYEAVDNNIVKHTLDDDITVKFGYFQFRKNLQLRVHGPWIPATDVVQPSIHAIAGNFFVPINWVKEVGYNTNIYFEAEEQVLALSSILAGYKIYTQRKIKCYHLIGSNKHTTRQDVEPVIHPNVIERNRKREEKELIDYIYSVPEDQLEMYRKITGVDYINRKLEDRAISRVIQPDSDLVNDWEIPNREKDDTKG
jgi:hypothetical protein